ncbi:hypothetical protein GF360_01715 [candidate division WWE3 bacterium]|nr:hypothetical protein [candidate division WWE3 bacterium]
MVDIHIHEDYEDEEEVLGSKTAVFTCPDCGVLTQDDVIFACNVCEHDQLIYKEGVYMCPQCLNPGENFICDLCGNKNVTLTFEKEKEPEEEAKAA